VNGERGGSTVLRNVGILPQHHAAPHPEDLDLNYSSLTLREEHKLRVFENEVPRRIFLPKKCNSLEKIP
jgi:hypothetical protein